MLARLLRGSGAQRRLLIGAATGLTYFAIGLWWAADFSLPGYVLLCLVEGAFVTLACLAVPPGRGAVLGLPAALVLMEAARGRWPLGGLPLAGLALGQADGPFAPVAKVGGPLSVVVLVGVAGAALGSIGRLRCRPLLAGAVIGLVGTAALTIAAPAGRSTGELTIAAVQGGGPRGLRALESDPGDAFRRHHKATSRIQGPVDVVLWPEDVVDVPGPVAANPEGEQRGALAQGRRTMVVAGVAEDTPQQRFRNGAVAWGPDGRVVARYDKAHRVPFGEYVPARRLVRRVADLSAVPRDAIPGRGPGRLDSPAGPLGVLISYEVFFPDRARAAVQAGAEVLLVPTNLVVPGAAGAGHGTGRRPAAGRRDRPVGRPGRADRLQRHRLGLGRSTSARSARAHRRARGRRPPPPGGNDLRWPLRRRCWAARSAGPPASPREPSCPSAPRPGFCCPPSAEPGSFHDRRATVPPCADRETAGPADRRRRVRPKRSRLAT